MKGNDFKAMPTLDKRIIVVLFSLLILVIVFFILDLCLGSYYISPARLLSTLFSKISAEDQNIIIIYQYRIPKAVTAILAGAALSVSGLQMQTIFRNPMAGPYVLGISSGASLGVALVVMGTGGLVMVGMGSVLSAWGTVVAAWFGSAAILFIIMMISSRIKDIMTILILGILISGAISAFVNILQYFSNEAMLKSFVIWTMGSLGGVTNDQLAVLAPSTITGIIIAILSSKFLDAFLLGENYARSMGMNIGFARSFVFLSTAILAGTITAFCGPIGFIGIAVPHLTRMLLKTALHGWLIPGSVLIGALMMLMSDIICSLPETGHSLPINSVTALMGIPIVMWIIIRNQKMDAL